MVEVEDDDVGFAAINTWVSSKVFTDERPILGAIPLILATSCRTYVGRLRM